LKFALKIVAFIYEVENGGHWNKQSSFTELIIEIKQKDKNKHFYEVYITE